MPEIKKDKRDRRQGDEGVNEPAAHKNAEPVSEVAHRFGQQRVDLALANVGCDLPFVLGWRDQIADQQREQVIINHRAVVVAVQAAAALVINGAPEKNAAGQRNQTEERAQKIIPAIHERVLEPDVEDRDILVDLHTYARRNSPLNTRKDTKISGTNICSKQGAGFHHFQISSAFFSCYSSVSWGQIHYGFSFCASSSASVIAAIMLSGRAVPFPAMANA